MKKIIPHLWFDNQAEEAAKFYTSIFKNSKITNVEHYGDVGAKVSGRPKGSVMTVTFQIDSQEFVALNGGPIFKFNESISFMVLCENQKELDYYWEKLSEGGDEKAQQCSWLKDKYGVSWQIAPTVLGDMLHDKNTKKSEKVMGALLKMKKIDIKTLTLAYKQG